MKKLFVVFALLLLISIAACRKEEAMEKKDVMEKKPEVPAAAQQASDTAVESVGSDLTSVESIEQELNDEELNELDAGLSDIENI